MAAVEPGARTQVLDDVERDRWRRFTDPGAARSYAALHILARTVIGPIVGRDPAALRFDRSCVVCGLQHGRPRLIDDPTLRLSLSRTRSVVVLATSRAGPVGVDVERDDAVAFAGFEEVALHSDDRGRRRRERDAVPDATAWVRKEAALKALGVGLRVDPASVRTPAPGKPVVVVPGLQPVNVIDLALDLDPDVDAWHSAAVALVTNAVSVKVHLH